jgi:hypothetical protein
MTTSGKGFAIDSYNVHRLVIAGVTVASKFFSGASLALLLLSFYVARTNSQMYSTQIRGTQK